MNNIIIVDYVTKIVLNLPDFNFILNKTDVTDIQEVIKKQKAGINTLEQILKFLSQKDFKYYPQKNKIIAYSDTVEAWKIKQELLAEGFKNNDFSIQLEYKRKWGTL